MVDKTKNELEEILKGFYGNEIEIIHYYKKFD